MTFISVHSIQFKSVVLTDVLQIRGKKKLKSSNNKWPCHIKKEKLGLKVTHLVISLLLQGKKKTINHSSWHNGAEQRILEFERLWNYHVGKFLCDLVLEDKKFM